MMEGNISFSFPAQRDYGIFVRMAVAGAAAALDLPMDALEDLCAAAEEALDYLLSAPDAQQETVNADLYRRDAGSVTLSMRFSGRAGTPCGEESVSWAILSTIMNEVTLFADARGSTGVRMALHLGD